MITINDVNNIYRKIDYDNDDEFRQLFEWFNIVDPSLAFTPLVRSGVSDGKKRFISLSGEFFYGLKDKVISFCEQENIEYKDNTKDNIYDLTDDEWNEFMSMIDLPFKPYDYQISGAKLAIREQRIFILSATGSGKSLILFILMMYYVWKQKKIILIVPDIGLIQQMKSDITEYFYAYEKKIDEYLNSAYKDGDKKVLNAKKDIILKNRKKLLHGKDFDDLIHVIFAGQEKHTDALITISTWQSTAKLASLGFFDGIDVLLFDEAHLSTANSFVQINSYCNAPIKIGMTGTMKAELVDQLVLEGTIGKAVRIVSSKKLIEMGLATETMIRPVVLKYSKETIKKVHKMKWQEEDKFIREHTLRLDFLKKFMLNLAKTGNSIIIFKNVQIQKDLLKLLKEEHEHTFMINGGVKAKERELIRSTLGEYNDAILIGTVTVLSTGINLPSLKNLVFGSIGKAEISIIQSCGRVMRLHDSKDKAFVWDIVDDLTYTTKYGNKYPNYYMKHYYERLDAYAKYEFPVMQQSNIQLEN